MKIGSLVLGQRKSRRTQVVQTQVAEVQAAHQSQAAELDDEYSVYEPEREW